MSNKTKEISLSEKPLTNKELFKMALIVEAAGQMLADVDLNAMQARLQGIETEAEIESPLTLATTREHLHFMMQLAEACRPIQDAMAHAPKPKGESYVHAISA